MTTVVRRLLILLAPLMLTGCAYRHYLGMHGTSVRAWSGIHAGCTRDAQCLSCHAPGSDSPAPPTSHPGFTGCLNCHNDPL